MYREKCSEYNRTLFIQDESRKTVVFTDYTLCLLDGEEKLCLLDMEFINIMVTNSVLFTNKRSVIHSVLTVCKREKHCAES